MKKRVLFVNATLGLGGVERSLIDVVNWMNEKKYDVYLYCDSTEGGLSNQLSKNISIIGPNLNGAYGKFSDVLRPLLKKHEYRKIAYRFTRCLTARLGERFLFLLRPFFRRYGTFDCVIAYREGFYTSFANTVFSHKRIIGWWHYGDCPQYDALYENNCPVDALITVSSTNEAMLKRAFSVMANRIHTIPNMINTPNISALADSASPFDRREGVFFLTSVSRLSPEKHLENAVFCAKKLKDNHIEFEWRIIGEGLEQNNLQRLIDEQGLSDRLILVGGQDNPYAYLRLSDLYVHPSYIESQGLAVLEAMALGVPCVVTKSRGPCEFIQDGINGLLTEQSPESLTARVLEILNDRQLYQRIRENTKCPEQFSPERVMKQIEALIDA